MSDPRIDFGTATTCRGAVIATAAPMAAAKLTASSQYAAPTPYDAITTPPTAGPMIAAVE